MVTSLLTGIVAMAVGLLAGCALRPAPANEKWRAVTIQWTERGCDWRDPSSARSTRIDDGAIIEELRAVFPVSTPRPVDSGGYIGSHCICIETETGHTYKAWFFDKANSVGQRQHSHLRIHVGPRWVPYDIEGPGADAFVEKVWLICRRQGLFNSSFSEIFSHATSETPPEIISVMKERQKRLDSELEQSAGATLTTDH